MHTMSVLIRLLRLLRSLPQAAAPHRLGMAGLELVPARLAKGRGLKVRRALAQGTWLLRDSGSGEYFAVLDRNAQLRPLQRLQAPHPVRRREGCCAARPHALARALGITRSAASRGGQQAWPEAKTLVLAGRDRYGRPLWLSPVAKQAWQRMEKAAGRAGVILQPISGFRSVEYQAAIVRRKLGRGLDIDSILTVNAAPGYSEHHTGRALDIGCPGEPPAEESFERTTAFAWLQEHAARFGFRLSYPRGNRYGIVYEPWHWCWHPPSRGRVGSSRS
jgi:D-alanyl-D-alanine carboxypeptidase